MEVDGKEDFSELGWKVDGTVVSMKVVASERMLVRKRGREGRVGSDGCAS